MKRLCVLGALAAVLSAVRAYGTPDPNHYFDRLLADPRQAQTSARYYRLAGNNMGDGVVGNSWPMNRWTAGPWDLQWDLEGMGYSRFLLSGGVNQFQTIDFFVNLPIEVRRGRHSGRFSLFHESSHLGDDYIRATGLTGFRYSVEGVDAIYSYEPAKLVRVYAGGSRLFHEIPSSLGATVLQGGIETRTPEFSLFSRNCWLYLAEDVKSKSQSNWNLNSNTELGLRVPYRGLLKALRVHVGYFTGHSDFGQFYKQREDFYSVGATFDF